HDASSIPAELRGLGLLHAEGALPVRLRVAYLRDEEIRDVVAQATELRGLPAALPAALPAQGQPYGLEPGGKGNRTLNGNGRPDLASLLYEKLNGEPITLSSLARAVGCNPSDGGVRRALDKLAKEGVAVKTARGWLRA